MFTPIHQHLIIKAHINSPFKDAAIAKEFLSTLVTKIGMVAVTEPQAVYVEESGNEGFTGSINLATSHIAFHIWDNTGLLMLDVYSCKHFHTEVVMLHIDKYLTLNNVEYITIDRENFDIIEKDIDNQ